jgi:hypothetical protein
MTVGSENLHGFSRLQKRNSGETRSSRPVDVFDFVEWRANRSRQPGWHTSAFQTKSTIWWM